MRISRLEKMEREADEKIRRIRAAKMITESIVGSDETIRKVIAVLPAATQKKITGILDGDVRKKASNGKEAKDEE